MIRKNTFVLQSVHIAVDLPLKVRHAPTPVDQEEADGQDDLQTCPGINQLTNDFLKMGQPRPRFRSFQPIQFLQQINVKNSHVHQVYSTGIRTHNLSSVESSPITTRPGLPPINWQMLLDKTCSWKTCVNNFNWDYIHITKESLTCDRRSKQPNTCDRYFAILPIGIDRLLAKTEAQRYVTLRGSSSSRRWKTWSSASPREGFSCFLWKQFGQF